MRWLTRLDMVFLCGNSMLLALEMMNPFFGYWHGVSESLIIGFSLIGARMLHYYSTRMINNMWLLPDGKRVEVEFMSAFMMPKTETLNILNFGYLEESRLLNVKVATYQTNRKVYVSLGRNVFK